MTYNQSDTHPFKTRLMLFRDVNKAGSFKAKAKSLKAKARSLKAKA